MCQFIETFPIELENVVEVQCIIALTKIAGSYLLLKYHSLQQNTVGGEQSKTFSSDQLGSHGWGVYSVLYLT